MNFLDDLMVKIAKGLLYSVMAIGTGFVYLQFILAMFVLAMIACVGFSMAIVAVLFGV